MIGLSDGEGIRSISLAVLKRFHAVCSGVLRMCERGMSRGLETDVPQWGPIRGLPKSWSFLL